MPAAPRKAVHATVDQLCDLYLADAEAGRLMTRRRTAKKASTLLTDRGRIERHIKPLLGSRAVAAVTHEDIEAFLHDVTAGKTAGWTKRGLARVRGAGALAKPHGGAIGCDLCLCGHAAKPFTSWRLSPRCIGVLGDIRAAFSEFDK